MSDIHAAALSLRSLLNCALREYPERVVLDRSSVRIDLSSEGDGEDTLRVPFEHRSPTGHHLFGAPLHLVRGGVATLVEPQAAADLLLERLGQEDEDGALDLSRRLRASSAFIARVLEARAGDLAGLAGTSLSFGASEQGLLAGHPIHPAPKAREGMEEEDETRYSPEFAARFPLRWFAVSPDLRHEGHACGTSAFAWIETALADELAPLRARLPDPSFGLLPVHPWQAEHLLKHDAAVRGLIEGGGLIDLGSAGGDWHPTSSVRTLYRPDLPFMLKLSLSVGITNSVRVNLARELLRGADMVRFRAHPAWERLSSDYPGLSFIADPAYLGVAPGGDVIDALSVSVRENPFSGERAGADVTLLAALCEDLPGRGSRLTALVRTLAHATDRAPESVALDWFEKLLACLVRPVVALYLRHGIALEAHSQNLLLELGEGWPVQAHYRDNQGFFHHDRAHGDLTALLPGLGEASGSVIAEDVVDERVVYYVLINSVFGLIGTLGRAGLADEDQLLARLAAELEALEAVEGGRSAFVRRALAPVLQVKGNLKTRLRGMDELVGPPETQSVYVAWANPLAAHARSKAKAHG